ncbi:MAG: MBL fold metallo-hydrolase [Patescibacteria group bacterium]
MDITYTKGEFKVKGKTGVLYSRTNGVLIESSDGNSKKELVGAGEYEVSGISVIGIKTDEGNIFVYEVDGLRICNLGQVSKKLSDNKLTQVGDIDILLLPNTHESIEIMQQIESYYVIPFGFNSEDELEKFLKESSLPVQKLSKFVLKKDDIVEDQTSEIIVISN